MAKGGQAAATYAGLDRRGPHRRRLTSIKVAQGSFDLVKLEGLEKIFDGPGDIFSIRWQVSQGPVSYPEAVAVMERRVEAIRREGARELVWLLEHPPIYTAGTSAKPEDLISPQRFPVFQSGRWSGSSSARLTRIWRSASPATAWSSSIAARASS
jgi:hypothetical protein